MGAPAAPRPWGRISFYVNTSHTDVEGTPGTGFGELTSAFTLQAPDVPGDGLDYGIDVRHSGYSGTAIPSRVSMYEGFVGGRMKDGAVRARAGYLWLTDLGSLGSVAGALVEVRQAPEKASGIGRLRVGGFYGLEPNILETGYAPDVTKYGVYAALDGERARRHVLGFVTLKNASLTERSVLTTTNFVPVGQKFFLYQALEYDMQAPAGQGTPGLTYFFANARVSPTIAPRSPGHV